MKINSVLFSLHGTGNASNSFNRVPNCMQIRLPTCICGLSKRNRGPDPGIVFLPSPTDRPKQTGPDLFRSPPLRFTTTRIASLSTQSTESEWERKLRLQRTLSRKFPMPHCTKQQFMGSAVRSSVKPGRQHLRYAKLQIRPANARSCSFSTMFLPLGPDTTKLIIDVRFRVPAQMTKTHDGQNHLLVL